MKKRIFSLPLTFALLLVVFASCGGEGGTVPADTADDTQTALPAETEAPDTDGLPETDMDGYIFKIYHNDGNNMTWTNLLLDTETQTGDVLEDAVYERNRRIEERFNCTVDITVFSAGQSLGVKEVRPEVMAGDSNYDLWFLRDYNIPDSIPYLRPMNDLPYISLDAEWWFPEASKVFEFAGEQYGATSAFSLSQISRAGGIVFDKELYRELGEDNMPYDYVKNGTWTLEKMRDIAKAAVKDLNGDNKMEDGDRFGIGTSWKEMYARFIIGSGISFIDRDKDGYPVFTLPDNAAAIEKMLHIYDLFSDPEVYYNPKSDPENVPKQDILTNTCLFQLGHPNNMGNKFRQSDKDIGYLPCPKYDEAQERYYAPTWAGEMMVILKTLPDERLENNSIILEALSWDSDRTVMDIYKEVMMKSKFARDPESEEMFDIVLDSMVFDFGLIAWEGPVANKLIGGIYANRKGNVASTLEAERGSIDGTIQKLMDNLNGNIE